MLTKVKSHSTGKRQNNFSKNLLFAASFFAATITGCKKDNTIDSGSPAYKIATSEKLVIPAEIALPANMPGGNTRVATYNAEGMQQYKAQVKGGSNPAAYELVFVDPKADCTMPPIKKSEPMLPDLIGHHLPLIPFSLNSSAL